ncbi:hypothetical protein U9M48_019747 [Paspalum notatum var. saurae]|uniref:Uncharacterized protein n=1 Tax=Paspalum notatum var. saurae TaxID=547442 RepID=A0AAQ3WRU0_PASNO
MHPLPGTNPAARLPTVRSPALSPGADSGSSQRPAVSAPRPAGARPPVRHRHGRAGAMSRFLRYKPNPRIETKTKRILGERNNDAVLNPARSLVSLFCLPKISLLDERRGSLCVDHLMHSTASAATRTRASLAGSNSSKSTRKRSYTHPEVYMLSGLSTCSEANAICNEMIYATAVRFYA